MEAITIITEDNAGVAADGTGTSRAWMPLYYLTTFLGAFLLFQVEPMLVKYLLPWFGGSSAVWTTSLLFFQLVLLGGYTYSHIVGTRLRPRNQARSHIFIILISLLLMGTTALLWRSPITPGAGWKPVDSDSPVLHLLALLTISIGLPYFVLATTAPLLQSWFARSYGGASAYRLYSLSNLGSLLALISYPLVVEPRLTVRSQALIWSALYAVFGAGIVFCAARLFWAAEKQEAVKTASAVIDDHAGMIPTRAIRLLWILLAACASLMLLATTSQLTQDVAPIPFLWILPLSLYLLSFIICFNNEGWYDRRIFHSALGGTIVLGTIVLCNPYSGIVRQIVVFSALLFCVCMVCHGELVRLKPDARHLTAFYLMVSIGGALGGLFAAIVAPHIFSGYWEFQLSIWGSALLLLVVLMRDRYSWIHQRVPALSLMIFAAAILIPWIAGAVPEAIVRIYSVAAIATLGLMAAVAFRKSETGIFRKPGSLVQFAIVIGLLALGKILLATVRKSVDGSLRTSRNFYGTLAVFERETSSPQWHYYAMRNGRIVHGRQYPEADKRRQPTAYYGPGSGIGLLMLHDPRRTGTPSPANPYRIGVVGLGAGTIAAYGRSGDYIRYYEINPDDIRTATDPKGYFTFIGDSPARVEIIPGDGRLSMERELREGNPQQFDVLTIDAFSGDAVPVHLLTKEAIAIYLLELKPDGVIAFHITNGYLDLRPVLLELARHFNLRSAWIHNVATSRMVASSDWVLLSRNDRVFAQTDIAAHLRSLDSGREVRLWTDDYSNLFQILK
jgi:hypothetical protein